MELKFKIGDSVKLKSGSPDMTVNQYESLTRMVECVWFHDTTKMTGSFHENSLMGLNETINEKSSPKDLLLG